MRTEEFIVETSLPSQRMDVYLKNRFPDQSRGTFQRLMEEGNLLVNDQPIRPTRHPRAGDKVTIFWPDPKPMEIQPEDIPLEILYEDESLLVLNKQAGICVHPAAGHSEHTLVNALLHHCQGQLSGIGGVSRPGIVHRLDLNTSGVLLVAKNDSTHQQITAQFSERSTEKHYLALLCGTGLPSEGKIEAPIARDTADRKRMAVPQNPALGRSALTTYKILATGPSASLVDAQIHTGRTHQIRVHFKHLSHPLVGDEVYGKRQNSALTRQTGFSTPRQMLHAWKLSFTHPLTHQRLLITAPPPKDLTEAVRQLIQTDLTSLIQTG